MTNLEGSSVEFICQRAEVCFDESRRLLGEAWQHTQQARMQHELSELCVYESLLAIEALKKHPESIGRMNQDVVARF